MLRWSQLFTIVAGVLAALVCYGVLTHVLVGGGLVHDGDASLRAAKMISANIGAIAAASVVAAWPSDRGAPLVESFTTWALATLMLMIVVVPGQPVSMTATASQDAGATVQNFASR